MEQHTLKNVNNYLNANIYSYLETSGGQSSFLYLNVVYFLTPELIRHLWQLKTFVFLHWYLICAILFLCDIVHAIGLGEHTRHKLRLVIKTKLKMILSLKVGYQRNYAPKSQDIFEGRIKSQNHRAELQGRIAGQNCRAELQGRIAGQNCRAK
jgi:hypothetical protein